MGFSRHRKRFITIEEMNQHLKYVYDYYEVVYRDKLSTETFKRKAFIHDGMVNFSLTYKKGSFACTYICKKDGTESIQQVDGGEAFRIMSQYYKVPKMTEEVVGRQVCGRNSEGGLSASPIIWYNENYQNQWIDAYGYDLNSAYSAAMLEDMPDTSQPMRAGIIQPGEIGFEEILNPKNPATTMLVAKYSGFSLYIFPLMKSPFTRFIEKWYDKKVNSLPGSKDKSKAKGVLNFSVGQLQNVNPFLRATIITKCNNLVKSLIDEDTLFCNTDSIVSKKPLNLKIGNGIGEWKLEHVGKVAYSGNNYQWDNGDLSFRGIPKSWFPEGWDITKDKCPKAGNIYEFKDKKLRLIEYENI